MTIRIKRSRMTSPTARALKESLMENHDNVRLLRTEGSSWCGTSNSLLINWGSSDPLVTNMRAKVLNKPEKINNATNKLTTFRLLNDDEISIPWYVKSTDTDFINKLANKAYESDTEFTLLFRTTATGFGGEGINILKDVRTLVKQFKSSMEVSLSDYEEYFTHLMEVDSEWSRIIRDTVFVSEYFRAKDEYRIHVICGGVAFSQRKGLRTDDDRPSSPNFIVRNHSNGFIFQQNNVEVPDVVKQASVKAVKALGLDFGAVDIRYNARLDKYSVLEVNTAPAVTGNTMEAYTNVFNSIYTILNED